MSDYGAHPTQYGNLSDGNLYAMYRESVYRSLSESQKLDLLQETVNRDAAARGEAGSPRIQFENMPSRTDGYAEKGVISVNRDLAVNGTRTATYQGKTLQHTINDYNIQSLVTVLHENVHCYQDQIIDGTIRNADPQLAAEYHANDFTISMVQQGNNLDFGSQYLTGETTTATTSITFRPQNGMLSGGQKRKQAASCRNSQQSTAWNHRLRPTKKRCRRMAIP